MPNKCIGWRAMPEAWAHIFGDLPGVGVPVYRTGTLTPAGRVAEEGPQLRR